MKKLTTAFLLSFVSLLFISSNVFAHVVVKPDEVGLAKFQTFTIGVPNEKEVATVGLRLLVPEGVTNVAPNVKPGWKIETKKTGEGEDSVVTEIIWVAGSIPAGQRDDFLFSALVPEAETTLAWKINQIYSDGTVASWDQDPNSETNEHDEEESGKGPWSETQVIDDIAQAETEKNNDQMTLLISIVALVTGLVGIGLSLRRKS